MARRFIAASTQDLTVNSTPITGPPCSIACWYRPTQTALRTFAAGSAYSGGGNFVLLGTVAGGAVTAYQYDSTTTGQATTAGTCTANVWQHIGAVYDSGGTSETAYLNGAGTSSTQSAVVPVLDMVRVAQAFLEYFDGDLAEIGMWNAGLTATEMGILALGVSPRLVRPAALVAYWPLLHGYYPEIDLVGHRDLTAEHNAPTTTVAGPGLYLTDPPRISRGAATGVASLNVALNEPDLGGSIF